VSTIAGALGPESKLAGVLPPCGAVGAAPKLAGVGALTKFAGEPPSKCVGACGALAPKLAGALGFKSGPVPIAAGALSAVLGIDGALGFAGPLISWVGVNGIAPGGGA
jgi:hypothetical protein